MTDSFCASITWYEDESGGLRKVCQVVIPFNDQIMRMPPSHVVYHVQVLYDRALFHCRSDLVSC